MPISQSIKRCSQMITLLMLAPTLTLALPSHDVFAQQVKELPLRTHLAFLADDLLEGRGTGQRGVNSLCVIWKPRQR